MVETAPGEPARPTDLGRSGSPPIFFRSEDGEVPAFLLPPDPPPMMFDLQRQRLLETLVRVLGRVQDHLLRMDGGVAGAVDDLSVALRVLVDNGVLMQDGKRQGGRGGHLLQRTVVAFDLDQLEILTLGPPALNDIFGVGSIPLTVFAQGLAQFPIHRGSLDEWLAAPVAVMSGLPEPVSWRNLIAAYANKLGGAHLDDEVPPWLERMDFNGVGGFSLTNYLLYQAGYALWHLGHEVVRAVMKLGGVQLAEDQFALPPGTGDLLDPPSDRAALGLLQYFYESEDEIGFLWFVDEDTRSERLRLYYQDAVWDIRRGLAKGKVSLTKPNNPDQSLYQSPRLVRYPHLGVDGVFIGSVKLKLFAVHTFQDLLAGTAFSFPQDYDPRTGGADWRGVGPGGEEFGSG